MELQMAGPNDQRNMKKEIGLKAVVGKGNFRVDFVYHPNVMNLNQFCHMCAMNLDANITSLSHRILL